MIMIIILAFMALALITTLYDDFEPVQATLIIVVIAMVAVGGFLYFKHTLASNRSEAGSVEVKYRGDRVPVGGDSFEALGPLSDNTVKNAWYDAKEEYLVIRLNSANYHYCEVPKDVWSSLKNAGSPYTYYQDALRGSYDCRTHYLPAY